VSEIFSKILKRNILNLCPIRHSSFAHLCQGLVLF